MTRPGNVEYPLYQLFWCIVIVAPFYFAIVYWYVTLPIVGIGLLIWWSERRMKAEADTIARAESQHARLMDGDESAIYGLYPPADL